MDIGSQRDVTGFKMKFVSNVRSGKLCGLCGYCFSLLKISSCGGVEYKHVHL
ncbi:MAG: hypothetical protein C5S47_01265 [Candidatus Methanogasteraceae archaeon]|nr:MAG: hypothetical protein C5S47_01265 [ANME-2 cluster archaeon]